MRYRPLSSLLTTAGLSLVVLTGCVTHFGPQAMPQSGLQYNQALARSWDEQLLLNLVRLRYRDTPVFLEVGSIISKYSFRNNAGASASTSASRAEDVRVGLSGGITFSEDPAVTYTPLHGEAFVRSLLSPISSSTLVLLSRSGWSTERLLLCCVDRVNGVENASAAAGPTPDYVPRYRDFQRVAELMRELQLAGGLKVDVDSDGKAFRIILSRVADSSTEDPGVELRELLGISPDLEAFRATSTRHNFATNEIALVGRSLLGVLFYLSQGVEPPLEHRDAGLVTRTLDSSAREFDWKLVAGKLLAVHSSLEVPEAAAVAVRHRGYWFYIDDTDLNSKSTFNLLSYLFALKAGSEPGKEPLLVLGVN